MSNADQTAVVTVGGLSPEIAIPSFICKQCEYCLIFLLFTTVKIILVVFIILDHKNFRVEVLLFYEKLKNRLHSGINSYEMWEHVSAVHI